MPPTIDATVGGASANSYETVAEAQAYFDTRLPLSGWDDADSQDVLLIMATRVLNALAQPMKTLVAGNPPYYRVRPQWLGAPATTTQRLAWPRTGLLDLNGNPLDVNITDISVANPTVITTSLPHGLTTGESALIFGTTDSTPSIDGTRVVTVISTTSFSIPISVTVAGISGKVTRIPHELKEAVAELAGQLGIADRTLDNDIIVQGISSLRAGPVSLSFNKDIMAQVIPDAVYNLMPIDWLTEELYLPANPMMFEVI